MTEFQTRLGAVSTVDCRVDELSVGDRIVGPDQETIYAITGDLARIGLLFVRNLTMTEAEASARLAEPGAVEAGADPRDGCFFYPPSHQMHLVR